MPMIRIHQIKVPVGGEQTALHKKIAKLLRTKDYKLVRIVKKSVDARDKSQLMYIYAVDVTCRDEAVILKANRNNNNITSTNDKKYQFPHMDFDGTASYTSGFRRPVIVGAGPAGYFCGLYLARHGYTPVILERGKAVEERAVDVERFWEDGIINSESNVSFGEGGAGTFSDGKLNTGIKDPMGRIDAVISDFIRFGAPEEIAYLNKPHVGTDILSGVMMNMRAEILSLGGEIRFCSKLIDYRVNEDKTLELSVAHGEESYQMTTCALVLAVGHSARDTFSMLADKALPMEAKAFAVGLRIEHPRQVIDEGQYGDSEAAKKLPAADYKMTYRSSEGRSVYSFCMCPGGFVVNASSDNCQAVVNGMSNHARDERNSNSAIVVNVTPDDYAREGFAQHGVLAGVEFQKKYEALAFREGKGKIPVQRFADYAAGIPTTELGLVQPNIKGSYTTANLNNCLPVYVNNAIIESIYAYDKRLKHFADGDAVLSGIESRTSSPVRIIRDESMMSAVAGIFPCGEGAGYAGGITSAAVDGIKTAEAVAAYINGNIKINQT